MPLEIRTAATYLTPLREGGSLPAVVEDDRGELWVVKFRGAGQGPKALIAELLVGGVAEVLELPVPGLALVELDEAFGQGERDPEIRDVLKGSTGINVGLRYLDGAFNLDPVAAAALIEPEFAARVVWLDALTVNPDRTARNPNLMVHDGGPWLIDHGAALFDHHDWSRVDDTRTRRAFPKIEEHVLLGRAGSITEVDAEVAGRFSPKVIAALVDRVPDRLLVEPALGTDGGGTPDELRARYRHWFETRLAGPRAWVDEAETARLRHIPPRRLESRR